ncbi:MAG: hypothetical protein KF774_05425 [Planctomyces sp.]|nr:hypothetical protein [Planctomyces sp.]
MSARHGGAPSTGRVVKIGGSLIDLPDLRERLGALCERLQGRPLAIVAGGGASADLVRDWDRRFQLHEEAAHWLALRAMRLNEHLLAALLPGARVVERWEALADAWSSQATVILGVAPLLRAAEARGEPTPPHAWDVTSDSLAAWFAGRLGARLVLVKSIDCPDGSAEAASASGAVDRAFPDTASAGLAVDWVNLRAATPAPREWLAGGRGPLSGS